DGFQDVACLIVRLMVGSVFAASGWKSPERPGRTQQEHWHEQGCYGLAGSGGACGRFGRGVWRANTTGGCGADPADAGRHPKENIRMEDRLLGQAWHRRLALRPDAGGDESGDHRYERRQVHAVEVDMAG